LRGVAQIDLGTRVVSLNGPLIVRKGLLNSVEALLAHEVGHHVCYPATLAVQARLRSMEKALIPIEDYSLINLFTDLLINERLGHDLEEPLVAVYRAFAGDSPWEQDPAFLFYMSVYEELWRRPEGELLGPFHAAFEREYPGYRADAQLLAQNLFAIEPNLYTQFLLFASVLSRYIQPRGERKLVTIDPNQCGCGDPSADDWAEAITLTQAEREAVERARREGWISEEEAERLNGPDVRERRIHHLPGNGTDEAERVPEIMAAYYRQQAERYLVRPPPQRALGEAVVPTTLTEWEPGDPARAIDWLATLVRHGDRLGVAQPLRREWIADYEGLEVPSWQVRLEIYLDVSGSMPNPTTTLNAMTLAAQILATGALRAGGAVRALIYSSDHVAYWQWCRSEVEMSRFLMHYVGGGTRFPFAVLRDSVAACGSRQPLRVVITDRDFDANVDTAPEHGRVLADAAACTPGTLLLLHQPRRERVHAYQQLGARVVAVEDLADFPALAGRLANALFTQEAGRVDPR
jgi:hypothetical protein